MAQTKKQRRRTKHRGNAVGMIESRGRTGRKVEASAKDGGKSSSLLKRRDRATTPPSWRSAVNRAALSAVALFFLLLLIFKEEPATAFGLSAVALVFYLPVGYYTDSFIYKRRLRQDQTG